MVSVEIFSQKIVKLKRQFVQITNLSNDALMQLLLYGDQYLSYDLNRNILELTLNFIHETGQFDQDLFLFIIN